MAGDGYIQGKLKDGVSSKDALTSDAPLLLLIPGSSIQVGQWARKIVINDNINTGSMFDYIRRARKEGFEVIVLNNNENYGIKVPGVERAIRGSESPEKHVSYVWENFVRPSKAKQVLIVAHSYGGVCTVNLVQNHFEEVRERVAAIAFTDSVHGFGNPFRKFPGAETWFKWFQTHAVNWARSSKPLDEPVDGRQYSSPLNSSGDCPYLSAGHESHDYTTVSAKESVFRFLKEKLAANA
ncbi:hypothetical protein HK104_003283 [Borealophlyctis nickersoniae]|nr:hypothetical protein HK104_003283 [Borealophlyctis nickersoniae]